MPIQELGSRVRVVCDRKWCSAMVVADEIPESWKGPRGDDVVCPGCQRHEGLADD